MILLKDEEITEVFVKHNTQLGKFKPIERQRNQTEAIRLCNKAQLKKVVEWGNEDCMEKSHWQLNAKKRECVVCWQSLLEEIK